MFCLQQLLKVLLCFLLHYRLAGTNVWKRKCSSATQPCRYGSESAVGYCNTHAGSAVDVPASTLSAPLTQTSSSALCPCPDVSVELLKKTRQKVLAVILTGH